MKICVFGAGAIGGLMAARLADAGAAEVTAVARGAHLDVITKKGITILHGEEELTVRLNATDDPASLGPQDYLVITLKAHSLPPIVDKMQPLLGPDTAVVTCMNGVPYWYFYGLDGPYKDRRIEAVDPGGVVWKALDPARVIGSVVYPAAEMLEPGVIRHKQNNRFSLGEPDGSRSDRALKLAGVLKQAGFRAPVRPRIRDEIWVKLWGNSSFNPVSALTGATLGEIANDPGCHAVVRAMMVEIQEVGEKLGITFPISVDKRIEGSGALGTHRTSMLQDLDHGKPLEIDALTGAVAELGRMVGVDTPAIDIVLALVTRMAKSHGCYLEG